MTTAGVALATVTETTLFSRRRSPTWAARPGATFGASVQPLGSQSTTDALLQLEDLAQRKFTTVHNRMPWETSLVNKYSEFIADRGQVPILSWFTRGRSDVKWSAIAAGAQDARIRSRGPELKAAGWPAYFCFHKEPENEPWLGNATEWKAAHERVWQIFQDVGVTNATLRRVHDGADLQGQLRRHPRVAAAALRRHRASTATTGTSRATGAASRPS